jgi:hypothetical protein
LWLGAKARLRSRASTRTLGLSVKKRIQLTITLGALSVALVHLIFPALVIDGITVTLLAIATVPWLGPLFKAIELPGGVKVEYHDLEQVEKKAEEAGLLAPAKRKQAPPRHIYAFESVAGDDPNLALAGLRIEIESRLRDIALSRKMPAENKPARWLLRELHTNGHLSAKEVSVIEDLLPLLNRAAHGAEVDERASRWALDIGTRLLRALEEKQGETSIPALLERWNQRDGAAGAEVGTELSKAFVTSPLAFLKAMKENDEALESWLKDIEHHTFTMFESRGELEDDLYGAYYEKLKALMVEAAQQALTSEYREQARRVLDALNNVQIRRIW